MSIMAFAASHAAVLLLAAQPGLAAEPDGRSRLPAGRPPDRNVAATQLASRPAPGRPAGMPPDVEAAAAELWRRGPCQLSNVYEPADKESAVPKDIGGVPVVTPRTIARKPSLLSYASDEKAVLAADDCWLYRASRPVSGTGAGPYLAKYGAADGLPTEPVQDIVCDGNDTWLATRAGLCRLRAGERRVRAVAGIRFAIARLAVGGGRVWAFTDTGVYWTPSGTEEWKKTPDPPGLGRLAQLSARGFWNVVWADRVRRLIPSAFANEDGLYVVCMNQFLRFDPEAEQWLAICDQAWQALAQGRTVWAMTTAGVVRCEPGGKPDVFLAGKGPSPGQPVAMAADKVAFWLVSQPDYDARQGKFVGGGISRFDATGGRWSVTEMVDGVDIRFAMAVLLDGPDAWVASRLHDRVLESGAHPGMAHVKRWTPHASGLALLRYSGGRWQLLKREGQKTETRWILGQANNFAKDTIGPDSVVQLCRHGPEVWGVYRMVPERYYAGYYMSVGCLAEQADGRWQARFDTHTDDLGLAGEQPSVLLLSASHGPEFVLGEGQPAVLGMESIGEDLWAVCQSGLFVKKTGQAKFTPVCQEEFRFYWAATAALPYPGGVVIGGDSGTISTLSDDQGLLVCRSLVAGRRITSLAARGPGQVEVRATKANVVLPANSMPAGLSRIDQDTFIFRPVSEAGSSGPAAIAEPRKTDYACKGNYLCRGDKKVAFLKGVFRPRVLCEDTVNGRLWLATYEGIACVPTSALAPRGRQD